MSKQILLNKVVPVAADGTYYADVTLNSIGAGQNDTFLQGVGNAYNKQAWEELRNLAGITEETPAMYVRAQQPSDEVADVIDWLISPKPATLSSMLAWETKFNVKNPAVKFTPSEKFAKRVVDGKTTDEDVEKFVNFCKIFNLQNVTSIPSIKVLDAVAGEVKITRYVKPAAAAAPTVDFWGRPIVQKRKVKRQLTEEEIGKLTTEQVKAYVGAKFTALANGNPNKATYDYLATLEVEVEETV